MASIGKITNAFARQLTQLLVRLFEATQDVVDTDGAAANLEPAGAVSPVFSEATVVFAFDVTVASLHLAQGTMQESVQEDEKYMQCAAACVDLASNVTCDTVRVLEKVSDTLHRITSESNDKLQFLHWHGWYGLWVLCVSYPSTLRSHLGQAPSVWSLSPYWNTAWATMVTFMSQTDSTTISGHQAGQTESAAPSVFLFVELISQTGSIYLTVCLWRRVSSGSSMGCSRAKILRTSFVLFP